MLFRSIAGAWQNPITSRRRWQRDQTPIQKQTKHRTQQTKHRAQRCLSKKKKNPKTQTKTKPSNPRTVTSPQRARCPRRRSPGRLSSQIEDQHRRPVNGRSIIGSSLCTSASAPVSGARCLLQQSDPPSRFLSNSLSVSLSLSH